MPEKMTELEFDFESYLANLLEAMNMHEAAPEIQKDVTLQLGRQLAYRLMSALSLSFEDEDWSNIMNYSDVEEFKDLIEKAIEKNPKIKEAVLTALNEFYEETVGAFDDFKNA